MIECIKKAFRPGKLMIAMVSMVILVFLGTKKVLAVSEQQEYPYLLKVNRIHNTITVYEKDAKGKYNTPVKAIVCSVGKKGTQTVLGTYKTKAKYRWKELMGKVYGQYSTRIVGGILFHSVYYYENGNPASLATKEYNKLGSAASHGCIRLTVEDAKWIYDNCPVGTTVIIYDDKNSPGPLGKPEAIQLSTGIRWDPTDPSEKNPYKNKKPAIYGVTNHSIPWGSSVDLIKGVTAKSTVGTDITENIVIEGQVNGYQAGSYPVSYTVVDALGRSTTKKSKVIVEESPNPPAFEGVSDRVVRSGTKLTQKSVLSGISVRFGDIAQSAKGLKASIVPAGENQYLVTYQYWMKDICLLESSAYYYMDGEAPEFSGVTNRIYQPGQIVDEALVRLGITVTDNFTKMSTEDIEVLIEPLIYDNELALQLLEELFGQENNKDQKVLTSENSSLEESEDESDTEYLDLILKDQLGTIPDSKLIGTENGMIEPVMDELMSGQGLNNLGEEGKQPVIYRVTYIAEDEVGNRAKARAYFINPHQ